MKDVKGTVIITYIMVKSPLLKIDAKFHLYIYIPIYKYFSCKDVFKKITCCQENVFVY